MLCWCCTSINQSINQSSCTKKERSRLTRLQVKHAEAHEGCGLSSLLPVAHSLHYVVWIKATATKTLPQSPPSSLDNPSISSSTSHQRGPSTSPYPSSTTTQQHNHNPRHLHLILSSTISKQEPNRLHSFPACSPHGFALG